ncbi:MAG: flavodoxin-dependent (E)-4-hydroxy-3-methylbut-2-enyl-diphosphate synthase, partial [Clostridia bacterium]|nr:flavodoxin-dependent (E)-4-hydroxy-3-methylbut-2-enyl-diphosphate synthase [Clostridia bacterium]
MSDIIRRKSRQVSVGDVKIGGDAPITVQSMLNAKTVDVDGSIAQIERLRAVGCDLIRLAVPDEKSAYAFGKIAKRTGLPLIADIHYNYKLAHLALDNGAKKIRM